MWHGTGLGVRDMYDTMVILVDSETASASELLACALRDNCKAVIIGDNNVREGLRAGDRTVVTWWRRRRDSRKVPDARGPVGRDGERGSAGLGGVQAAARPQVDHRAAVRQVWTAQIRAQGHGQGGATAEQAEDQVDQDETGAMCFAERGVRQ